VPTLVGDWPQSSRSGGRPSDGRAEAFLTRGVQVLRAGEERRGVALGDGGREEGGDPPSCVAGRGGSATSGSPLDTSWEEACVHRSRRWHLRYGCTEARDEDEPHRGRRRRASPPQRSRRTQRKSGRGTVDGECRLALDPASTLEQLEREAGVVAGDLGSFGLPLRALRALRGDPSDDRSGFARISVPLSSGHRRSSHRARRLEGGRPAAGRRAATTEAPRAEPRRGPTAAASSPAPGRPAPPPLPGVVPRFGRRSLAFSGGV
jgi:hypothetical protein